VSKIVGGMTHIIPKIVNRTISIPIGELEVQMAVPPEQAENGSRISFWWGITTASVALSRHIASSGKLTGQKAIELGCGLGLAGITAGLSGAQILFTDYVSEALVHAADNCRLNRVEEDSTDFSILDWDAPHNVEQFDLVLGAEILYDYFFHRSLINLLDRLLAPRGRIILADRKRLVVSRFLGRLISTGFDCVEIQTAVRVKGFPEREISIFELKKSEPS
jgi:predicted nicotinamide N-methyase